MVRDPEIEVVIVEAGKVVVKESVTSETLIDVEVVVKSDTMNDVVVVGTEVVMVVLLVKVMSL